MMKAALLVDSLLRAANGIDETTRSGTTIRRNVTLMSKSYFPADRAGRIDWYDNFAEEFPNVGKDLDFSDAEIGNAVNDAKYAVHILTAFGADIDADPGHAANAVLSGQSSSEYVKLPSDETAPNPVRPGIDTRRQARVERIKAHPKFNAGIARRLRIDTEKFDASKYKAELGRARQTGNFVTIPFRKAGGGVSGINLYRQGKGDKSPKKVGFFFRTPAIDTSPGKGELKYTARAVLNGQEVGQSSDAVTASVS
jgi:hypothetical protein